MTYHAGLVDMQDGSSQCDMINRRSIESLKKQMQFLGFSRQNFTSVSQKRLSAVYNKLNQENRFNSGRQSRRPMTYLQM